MQPDTSGLKKPGDPCSKNQTKKQTLKRPFFSRKPLETKSLAEVHIVIGSCCLDKYQII